MTFQMYLLEREMEATQKRSEEIALKMIRKGKSLEEIQEFTDLPAKRINELAQVAEWQTDSGFVDYAVIDCQ